MGRCGLDNCERIVALGFTLSRRIRVKLRGQRLAGFLHYADNVVCSGLVSTHLRLVLTGLQLLSRLQPRFLLIRCLTHVPSPPCTCSVGNGGSPCPCAAPAQGNLAPTYLGVPRRQSSKHVPINSFKWTRQFREFQRARVSKHVATLLDMETPKDIQKTSSKNIPKKNVRDLRDEFKSTKAQLLKFHLRTKRK